MSEVFGDSKKVRFALVGCGRISAAHFDAMTTHRNSCELVDVCDIDSSALAKAVAATGVQGHQSIEDLLQESSADCVVISTPSGLHAQHVMQVATSGRSVITEKPMATKWNDGLQMLEVCTKAGVDLFVVKQNRHNPTLALLKRAIDDGRFGRIFAVAVNVFWTRPQSYYDAAPWRGTWAMDGGAFMNQASHYVDLLDWLIGPVDSVHAMTATLARSIEAEDTGVINIRWKHGALGSMTVTMLTYPSNYEGSITILGERGTVKVGGIAVNKIEAWEFEDHYDYDDSLQQANYETTSVYGHGHRSYYANVIRKLRGESTQTINGVQGLRSLELLEAIYRSARTAEVVSLPLSRTNFS